MSEMFKDIEKFLGHKAFPNIPFYPSMQESQLERTNEIIRSVKSAPQTNAENLQEAIRDHISILQGNLSEDEQLLVYFATPLEHILVHDIVFPNWHTVILLGKDTQGNEASLISAINTIQLTCKVIKLAAPDKPYRIGFTPPAQSCA